MSNRVEDKITLYWDKEFKEEAKDYAKDKGVSLSSLTKKLVAERMNASREVLLEFPLEVLQPLEEVAAKNNLSLKDVLQRTIVELLREAYK